jgi:outer membrane protein assembly factor BamB
MANRQAVAVYLHFLLGLSLFAVAQNANVLTQHNDTGRTGANLGERTLSATSVKQKGFGKLFYRSVDGQIYAQPLVMSGVDIPGKGTRNVVYVVTMRNNVYAFDADGGEEIPLWKVSLGKPLRYDEIPLDVPGGLLQQYNIRPFIGITSTPVIDPELKRLYVVAKLVEPNKSIVNRIYAIDMTDGHILKQTDIRISANGSDPSEVARAHLQRPALLLANGMVYAAFGSHQDAGTYNGWLLAFDRESLEQKHAFSVTPGGDKGGIWQSGNGPAADSAGNIYMMTGNGSFNPDKRQFGNSFVKLSPDLNTVDWFAPAQVQKLNLLDIDLGSAGPVLLPEADTVGGQEIIGAGKEGKLYLLNRSNLGHQQHRRHWKDQLNPPVQFFQAARRWRFTLLSWIPFLFNTGYHHIHGSPVYWHSKTLGPLVYLWPEEDDLRAFKYDPKTKLNPSPIKGMKSVEGMPGGILSISANGQEDGILWAATPLEDDAFVQTVRGVLRAFDANTLELLWSSDIQEPDDHFDFAKYVHPLPLLTARFTWPLFRIV